VRLSIQVRHANRAGVVALMGPADGSMLGSGHVPPTGALTDARWSRLTSTRSPPSTLPAGPTCSPPRRGHLRVCATHRGNRDVLAEAHRPSSLTVATPQQAEDQVSSG
jgi:hypothetical protein